MVRSPRLSHNSLDATAQPMPPKKAPKGQAAADPTTNKKPQAKPVQWDDHKEWTQKAI